MRAYYGLFVIGLLGLTTPSYADGKCGDAPYAFAEDDLVDTWIVPAPKGARIRYASDDIFTQFEKHVGPEIPSDLPDKYRAELRYVELSNAQISTTVDEAAAWLKRYGIPLEDGPRETFSGYVDRGYEIFSTLIEHPPVSNVKDFVACSIILQRGIIVMNEGRGVLYLRSYFHSTDGKGEGVNFVPKGSLQITFPSTAAWFPLELTKHITEPESIVVLDVVTAQPLKLKAPDQFNVVGDRKKVELGGLDYFVTRFQAKLAQGKDAPDFSIELK